MKIAKMDVKLWFLFFKLLLFQNLISMCRAAPEGSPGGSFFSFFLGDEAAGDSLDDGGEEQVQVNIRKYIHTGLYSRLHLNPSLAEVTSPKKVTWEGALVSHALEHEHDETHERAHARSRRAAKYDEELDHVVHYNITVEGRELRLDLRPSLQFINPHMVVERHRADSRTRERPPRAAAACHYIGAVRGQPASSVAISACDGLAGMLRTEHGEYWVEPAEAIDSSADPSPLGSGRPHVVYKREALGDAQTHELFKRDILEESNNKSHNRHKREVNPAGISKELRRRHRRRRRGQTNCGTREPPREAVHVRWSARPDKFVIQEKDRRNGRGTRPYKPHPADLPALPSNNTPRNLTLTEQRTTYQRNNQHQQRTSDQQRTSNQQRARSRHRTQGQQRIPGQNWTRSQQKTPGQQKIPSQQRTLNQQRIRSKDRDTDGSPREAPILRRRSRSVSKARHVEVLLVADTTMTDFHQKGNVETYLLTIMNMVSSLYLDPTIGNFINVVVVKIILVEELGPEPRLKVSTNADETLAHFCKWQQQLQPGDDSSPAHHDVAILVTRKDICARQNTPCSTLGVAQVAGMCLPEHSCSVNEDNGITLAHTITHELGHNFGLYHDTEKIGCLRRVGSTLHVMTPIFEADTVEVAWSRCSRRDVTNFLDSGMGECLSDQPAQVDYIYPELPAGVLYSAAAQCRLQFGAGTDEVCTDLSEMCERLWCFVNNTCTTMMRPAAPGTPCGENMWCQNRVCVPRTLPPPAQDGGWAAWGTWSACSRTCGAGISIQARECSNPLPKHGGKFCTGERTRYKICNTAPCSKTEASFREVQCSAYDHTTYENKVVPKWIPYFDQDEPCELYCSSPDQSVLVPFGEYAIDGTPCNVGARDMCIAGICRKIGCDWRVDSNATEDVCGICNGDGSACKTVQGIYSKGTTKESGYSEVAVIPAGSRNVRVEEISNSKNYIGIGSAKTHKFYLNGRRKITLAGEYLVAGSPALYERDRDWEKVRIPGPIKEDIRIYQMIYRGKHRNPGVRYQYTVDSKPKKKESRYSWKLSGWTPCTRTCGGGVTRQLVKCVLDGRSQVDQEYCLDLDTERPSELMRECGTSPCPSHWWVGRWSGCMPAISCLKPGQRRPMKRRHVLCVDRHIRRVLLEQQCDPATKPVTHIPCMSIDTCHT